MATGSNPTAKFSIPVEADASSAKEAADIVARLAEQMRVGEEATKEWTGALRRLRGSSDEVKAAKEALKAKIGAEKDAISAANLQLLKHGTTYDKLSAKSKKLAADQADLKKKMEAAHSAKIEARTKAIEVRSRSMGSAIGAAGGPASALKDKLGGLNDIMGGAGGAMGAVTLGAAALAAAILAVAAASVAGVVALSKWIITSANAARTAGLFREAATGSASNAYALGTQIDALSQKVPTAKAALNEMGISMAKGGIQGQTLVDTLNAVAQASAALGEDAGNKLREFVDRGRLTQRFAINPLELQGTGVQFDDIAKELAANLKVGVGEARKALFEGRVKLGDGAKAMRDAVEKKFGGINLRRMLDLDVMAEKLKERLASLTSGVNLEPLLRGLNKLGTLFDESTFTGFALKQVITTFGNTLGTTFETMVPFAIQFIKGMAIAALKLGTAFFVVRNSLVKTFGDSTTLGKIDGMNLALKAGKVAVYGIGVALLMTAGFVAAVIAPFVVLGAVVGTAVFGIYTSVKSVYDLISGTNWTGLGGAIVDGLVAGLKLGGRLLVDTVSGLADKVKTTFTDKLGIHSPSRVFAEYGRHTTAGYAEGVEDGSPDAASAVSSMAGTPGGSAKRSGGGGGLTVQGPLIQVTVNGGESVQAAVTKEMSDPGFKQKLQQLLFEAALGAGVPA